MHEIKFRGKREDGGEWVYGYYVVWLGRSLHYINTGKIKNDYSDFAYHEVIPGTVGQYTGICAIGCVEIFKDDIIEFTLGDGRKRGVVVWLEKGYWAVNDSKGKFIDFLSRLEWVHVIGNTHDNPDLLKEMQP